MNAGALEQALRALGVPAEVTVEGPLAVVRVPADDRSLEDATRRRAAVALAAEHGFRTLALEVVD